MQEDRAVHSQVISVRFNDLIIRLLMIKVCAIFLFHLQRARSGFVLRLQLSEDLRRKFSSIKAEALEALRVALKLSAISDASANLKPHLQQGYTRFLSRVKAKKK